MTYDLTIAAALNSLCVAWSSGVKLLVRRRFPQRSHLSVYAPDFLCLRYQHRDLIFHRPQSPFERFGRVGIATAARLPRCRPSPRGPLPWVPRCTYASPFFFEIRHLAHTTVAVTRRASTASQVSVRCFSPAQARQRKHANSHHCDRTRFGYSGISIVIGKDSRINPVSVSKRTKL